MLRDILASNEHIGSDNKQFFCFRENLHLFKLIISVALVLSFYISSTGWLWFDSAVKKNKDAMKLYNEQKFDEALKKLHDAQVDSPDRHEISYNIGNTLYKKGEYDNAVREYEKALSSKDAELQARIYYNMGNAHYRMGRLPEAIEDYKNSLDINPDDEDAKYNIEFIRKKLKAKLEKRQAEKKQGGKKKGSQQEVGGQQEKLKEKKVSQGEGQKGGVQAEDKGEREERKQIGEKEAKEEVEQRTLQKEKEMSEEDARRLLDALREDEKEILRELRTQPIEGRYRIDKDW